MMKGQRQTGRMHQLRIHCAAIGHPIVGDYIYDPSGETPKHEPLFLHARSLKIPLYPKKEPITVEASPPSHMLSSLQACGYPVITT